MVSAQSTSISAPLTAPKVWVNVARESKVGVVVDQQELRSHASSLTNCLASTSEQSRMP